MRELIVYATPVGPLAGACDRYFAAARSLGATTAQAYPPHCTLTGFFHCPDDQADAAIAHIGQVLRDAGPVPPGAVRVVGLVAHADWVGLELESPWLLTLTRRIAASRSAAGDCEPVRTKDWLHLSLAYGVDDLAAHAQLAEDMVDPGAACSWAVAVWERDASTWVRHGPPQPD